MKSSEKIYKFSFQILLLILGVFFIKETIRYLPILLLDDENIGSFEEAVQLNPTDAELNFRLANFYSLFMTADENKIKSLYIRSLESNPLLAHAWLGLTDMFISEGDKNKAFITLEKGMSIFPTSIARLWEGSILALRLGDTQLAMKGMKVVAKADPRRRTLVFDTSWQVIGNEKLILDNIISDEILPDYLYYLATTDKLDEASEVWKRIKTAKVQVSNKFAFSYIDLLIRKNRISEAYSTWTDRFGNRKGDSLIWNGDFEDKPLGGGFDWQSQKIAGVTFNFDRFKKFKGTTSFELRFDGAHNLDFYHLFQFVPVEPDTDYTLSSLIATNKVTTRNGLGWEVVCFPAVTIFSSNEFVRGTEDWKKVGLDFHTPAHCNFVVVRLRRYASDKIDKNIAGTAWIDDVKLVKSKANKDADSRDKGI